MSVATLHEPDPGTSGRRFALAALMKQRVDVACREKPRVMVGAVSRHDAVALFPEVAEKDVCGQGRQQLLQCLRGRT